MSAPTEALAGVIGRTLAVAGEPVTYRIFTGSTLNPQTGHATTTFVDVACHALVEPVSVSEAGASPIQMGDVRIHVAYADLVPALVQAERKLSTSDRLTIGGIAWRVIAFELTASGTLLRVLARRL